LGAVTRATPGATSTGVPVEGWKSVLKTRETAAAAIALKLAKD
jgi:hypothetical protein